MTENLREWIFGALGAAALTWMALFISPKGPIREVTRLLCGVVLIIALISPLAEFDYAAFAVNISKYREEAEMAQKGFQEENDRLSALIIEDECAAYILDKAQDLSLETGGVTVTAKRGDEGLWYPYEAYLDINGLTEAKQRLQNIIESELGIPVERQYWSGGYDG